ncbi:DUF4291 domain-containing protein [Actinoplanes sp. CA-015351]|uniref:DUF4291 domain-containing protein n=1 Tax=Actinoplanes sp. CA-015351 TaxID=3239897 RepID=UPI003D96B59D
MREVRATFDEHFIVVYQAYSDAIADAAVRAGRFVTPFKRDRMTWIKPSFLWMMYRSGWTTKPGQERILAVSITREGFEKALAGAVHSSYERNTYPSRADWQHQLKAAPTRVQWDPERDLHLRPLPHRSRQLGLSGAAINSYADEWTIAITDITDLARKIHSHLTQNNEPAARALLPPERPYPLPFSP